MCGMPVLNANAGLELLEAKLRNPHLMLVDNLLFLTVDPPYLECQLLCAQS